MPAKMLLVTLNPGCSSGGKELNSITGEPIFGNFTKSLKLWYLPPEAIVSLWLIFSLASSCFNNLSGICLS